MPERPLAPGLRPFDAVGGWTIAVVDSLGRFGSFFAEALAVLVTPPFKIRAFVDRIHFVGRKTEIINVGGAKVHPLPIEERIGTVPGVELSRVYGRANPVTGQIVAADVVPAEGIDHDRLDSDIRRACEALMPAARPRVIRFVDALELRGAKITRSPSHRQ